MKTIILDRDDVRSSIHDGLWEGICEDLGLAPTCKHCPWPERIEIKVASAEDAS